MLLYNAMVSGNCYKARLILAKRGIEYERRELSVFDRSDRPDVLAGLNPSLRVPTLVFDDGRTLAESNAILFFFGEDTELYPNDRFERAAVLQWMFYEQYDLEPTIAVVRFWELAGIHPATAELEAKRAGGERTLAALDRHLADREFLVADRFTIADMCLFAYTHVAPEGGFSLEPHPAIRRWIARVAAQPGHIAITD
ncbi:MAG: glutathione S-transferase family protein [Solirubrobacteraceae bacterium]